MKSSSEIKREISTPEIGRVQMDKMKCRFCGSDEGTLVQCAVPGKWEHLNQAACNEAKEKELWKLRVRVAFLENVLQDLSDYGTRADLNPTICIDGKPGHAAYVYALIGFFYGYIQQMDSYVRRFSTAALQKDTGEGRQDVQR